MKEFGLDIKEFLRNKLFEMSTTNLCTNYKFGFCKYAERCRKRHVEAKCQNSECDGNKCERRHPHSCKFFLEFKRCKFGEYCRFLHKYQDHSRDSLQIKSELQMIK